MKYNIVITVRAEEMLDHILYYIFNQLKNFCFIEELDNYPEQYAIF